MQNENKIQRKKFYAAPTMKVVKLRRQKQLLEDSSTISAKTCEGGCVFD